MNAEATFGSWLRERRQALDLTQSQLASQVGCATDTVRMIEAGRRRPSREVAELLGKCLGIAPGELPGFIEFARGTTSTPPAPVAAAPAVSQRPAGALPALPTPLIGRAADRARLLELLAAPKPRLITIIGPPGIGKTSLAIDAAGDARAHFPDGVYFVPLAPISDPQLVATTIVRVLGLTPPGTRPLVEALHDYLWTRNLLLVLDNFEQLMPAAALVAEILQLAPRLRLLVTSRGTLRLRGEKEFALAPLELPGRQDDAMSAIAGSPAVQLFVERAADARDGFALTRANAAAVAEITRRLEGLPLAIELAAARVSVLTPEAMLPRLASRLDLLADGPTDLPLRQRTLRSAIAWGYDLLTPHEQSFFRRLGVFVGGWTLEAAEAVAGAETRDMGKSPPTSVITTLDALTRMSMVRLDEVDGPERFWMLETIREYAQEKLEASGEGDALREAHTTYFLQLVESAAPELTGPSQALWLNRLEAENDNLRAVLRRALDQERPEIVLRIGGVIWWFWRIRAHSVEGRALMIEALDMEARLAARRDQSAEALNARRASRAFGLNGAGRLAWETGDYPLAFRYLEESLALYRELDDKAGMAIALGGLGIVAMDLGDYRASQRYLSEAVALNRETGETRRLSSNLNNLATVYQTLGDYETARSLQEQGIAVCRETGNRWDASSLVHNLGNALFELGDLAAARARHEEALLVREEMGDRLSIASGLNNLGSIMHRQGETEAGLIRLQEALNIRRELGSKMGTGISLRDLAAVQFDLGDYAEADANLREALAIHRALGSRERIAHTLIWLAGSVARLGDPATGAFILGVASALHEAMGIPIRATDTPRHGRITAYIRDTIGASAWQEAFDRGHATPLYVAIAALLDGPGATSEGK